MSRGLLGSNRRLLTLLSATASALALSGCPLVPNGNFPAMGGSSTSVGGTPPFSSTGYVLFGGIGAAGATGSSEYDGGDVSTIDSQGRIVVAGWSKNSNGGQELAIWRYNADGSLDTSFGGFGYVTFGSTGAAGGTGSGEFDYLGGEGLQLDSSGNILVVGQSKNAAGGYELAIWRYRPNGSIDTSFGSGAGYVTNGTTGAAGATGSSEADFAHGLALDSSGRLVISGESKNTSGGSELAIWRYNASGTPDTTFGTSGHVLFGATGAAGATGVTEFDSGRRIVIDGAGDYIIAGDSSNTSNGQELAVWKYLSSTGALDTTFASVGYTTFGPTGAAGATGSTEYDNVYWLQLDSSGRIVIAGESENSSLGFELALWRYTTLGTLDASFASTGYTVSGVTGVAGGTGASENDQVISMAIDALGNLVLGGFSRNAGNGYELALWRYQPNGALDTSFGSGLGYVVSGNVGAAGATGSSENDECSSSVLDSSGRIVCVGYSRNSAGGYEFAIWRFLSDGLPDN